MKRDRSKEKPLSQHRPGMIRPPADYDLVKDYIAKLEADGANHMYKLKENPKTKDKMWINHIYMVESFASKLASLLDIDIYTQDLMFLLWLRDYEYVSRTYIVKTLGFPSHYASYKFLQRLVKNGFVKVVRTRHVGVHNGSAFYITKKGEDLALRTYNALKDGRSESFKH